MVGPEGGLEAVGAESQGPGGPDSQLVAAESLRSSQVETARPGSLEEEVEGGGQGLGVHRGPELVGEEAEPPPLPQAPGHAFAGRGPGAVTPPDHEGDAGHRGGRIGGQESLLAGQLGAAIETERSGPGLVGEGLVPAQDEVGGEPDEPNAPGSAQPPETSREAPVDLLGQLGLL
jgi:hypothetical protein